MLSELPLIFYSVRENSVIYLENIQDESTSQSKLLKNQLSTKSKYFKSIGLLPSLGTIRESTGEDKESLLKIKILKENNAIKIKGDNHEPFVKNEVLEVLILVSITR